MIDRSEVEEELTMLFNLRDAISQASKAVHVGGGSIMLSFRIHPNQVRGDYPRATEEERAEIARKRQLAHDGCLQALKYHIEARKQAEKEKHGENHD